ncbi:MAG: hypothetical protein KIT84_43175 [Labilithrix sp.]|nr:hypothetical protein [Labilithrix sp.]
MRTVVDGAGSQTEGRRIAPEVVSFILAGDGRGVREFNLFISSVRLAENDGDYQERREANENGEIDRRREQRSGSHERMACSSAAG